MSIHRQNVEAKNADGKEKLTDMMLNTKGQRKNF
jgi:hypothetical protein